MSEDNWFKRHKWAIFGGASMLSLFSFLLVLSWANWIPGLGFLLHPLVLGGVMMLLLLVALGFGIWKLTGAKDKLGISPGEIKELSRKDCQELARYHMWREYGWREGRTEEIQYKPVVSGGEESSVNVFHWILKRKRSREKVAIVMLVEQDLDFKLEYLERRHEQDWEKVEDALNNIKQISELRESNTGDLKKAVNETREEMGQNIRDRVVTEFMEDGEVTKREKKDLRTAQIQQIKEEVENE